METKNEITVEEIMMKSPVTLKPKDTLDLANDIISLGRIRHIPVLDNGKLVGLLSQRDLFGTAATAVLGLKGRAQRALLKSFVIEEIMTKRVITTSRDRPLKEAARTLAVKKIGCLPVMEGDSLVGLLTTTDVLRHFGA